MPDYHVAFWNLENLFDIENSPRRSEKLQRTLAGELAGWTREVLDRKIQQLASIIRQMNNGTGPDLLGVCEVENRFVLERLLAALGPLNRPYDIAHHDMSDDRGIDVAFIYDTRHFTAEEQFSHVIVKRSATRDLFQVNFRTSLDRLLVVVGNHWPSRSGGQYESEPYRMIAGETLAYFHERIREVQEDNEVAILAMGDFNDEPYNRSVSEYALSERGETKVIRAQSAKFLNMMWPLMGQNIGTHYYDNVAGVLDQMMISKGLVTGTRGIRALTDAVAILQFPDMRGGGVYPVPIRFGRGQSLNRDGFSDHYPIAVQLREM